VDGQYGAGVRGAECGGLLVEQAQICAEGCEGGLILYGLVWDSLDLSYNFLDFLA
jgi:hypothetical protein